MEQTASAAEVSEFVKPHRGDSRLLVTFLALTVIVLALGWLASEVAEGDVFAIDKRIMLAFRHSDNLVLTVGPEWLAKAMVDFTALGGSSVLTLITIFAVGFLLAVRKFAFAGLVAAAISGGAILSVFIKGIFERPRPEIVPHLVEVSSASFPSGHAMNSAIVYLTLAVLLARSQERRRVQVYLVGIAICLVLLIGFTRIFLGVHWPSDVLAGWTVGAMWAALCSLIAKYLQRERKIERPHEESPHPSPL